MPREYSKIFNDHPETMKDGGTQGDASMNAAIVKPRLGKRPIILREFFVPGDVKADTVQPLYDGVVLEHEVCRKRKLCDSVVVRTFPVLDDLLWGMHLMHAIETSDPNPDNESCSDSESDSESHGDGD